ncbi:carboxymuconolactone decarboxylase family protein [Caballeronia sp. LjRoot34]|uniref:carboxymuconolactone decarboxylase family protein n=1 Tax=Caballeronia sp. LjRoot34 TaxID=3342325 RepID=UPI003ED0AF8D
MAARIVPLKRAEGEANDQLNELMSFVGYRPNALFTMARKPGLLPAVLQMVNVALRDPGLLDPKLRFLVACDACRVAQCFYSTAHMVHAAHQQGISWERLAALDHAADSGLFTSAELAALGLAAAGATLPVGSAQAAFDEAAHYFSEDELLEIVSAIALFGWFNRWNGLIGSELEREPATVVAHVPWLALMRHQLGF